MRNIHRILAFVLIAAMAPPTHAITWGEVEVVCPICGTKNTFHEYISSGSYVYGWPSRFQYVFWPYTSSSTLYSCKKCHLTLFMWDFTEFPKEKIAEAQSTLTDVELSGDYKDYTDIPGSEKLAIAERVYNLLAKEDEFWAHFYRLQGYFLAQEKKPTEARVARTRALAITEKMLTSAENEGRRKELLVSSGAMRYFLGDSTGAVRDLQAATSLKFVDKELHDEKSKNVDGFLSRLIADYLQAIKEGKVPKDDGTEQ